MMCATSKESGVVAQFASNNGLRNPNWVGERWGRCYLSPTVVILDCMSASNAAVFIGLDDSVGLYGTGLAPRLRAFGKLGREAWEGFTCTCVIVPLCCH